MGSGLIYVAIVGMWVAYFLPRWIANHEELSSRSIERFADTMRLVARTAGNATFDLVELRERSEREMSKRRTTFGSLVALTVIVIIFIAMDLIASGMIAIPISAITLYVVHARHQVAVLRREIELAKNSINKPARSKYSELIARSIRVTAFDFEQSSEQWVPLAERYSKSNYELQGITILPKGSAREQDSWEPRDVPAPRYQSAAKAAPHRRIDLTKASALDDRDLFEAIAPSADQIFDQQLAEAAAERIQFRAANE